ncbi:hypothetical protein [Leisingera daeponensis]|uniref:hypothetical protein n=1 Tax=Leisingera daeponensis TaxID=405746 RepID=UPI001C965B60|nr:hypothetical protein [Leisingera daeponensis]MBY6055382.1 hypothetical protein [Leisingera daeponensis]
MRLNLNLGPERYELFPAVKNEAGDIVTPAVAFTAEPALSDVVEAAKADPSMIEFADEIRDLIDGEASGAEIDRAAALRAKGKGGLLFARALARLVITEWEGIEDPDGSPAPVTPDRVDAFISLPPVYDRFTEVYVARWLNVQHEKNGSAPSQNGTTAGATNTARGARKSAKPARAKSTSRKR